MTELWPVQGQRGFDPGQTEGRKQVCQMVWFFHTKNTNIGIFWRALEWKMLVNFMFIANILQQFGIFYGRLVNFAII
jgi:hypothetical protein